MSLELQPEAVMNLYFIISLVPLDQRELLVGGGFMV